MSADEAPQLQLAVWSPAGSALAFVYRNDIYYRPRADAETVKVTHTGRPGVVFNGVPDWLYEEEVLQTRHALWFSPDGRALLFATFNDTQVDELRFPWFGGGAARLTQYPELRSLRYPRISES
ncbi:Inactive dipeptidyl peptidase 10 [Gryllus bimaculatus]|nr:Inactive dipeptidyl peptidase 10 [Gryllus bimaculatus]